MLTTQEITQIIQLVALVSVFFTMVMIHLISARGALFMNLARVAPPNQEQLTAFQLKYGEEARKDLEKELEKLRRDKS
ncbi:hypothetical protein KBA73_00695 [Patescibacteria group bacterium]|nr:hypothetical protein [Patescibacteria group bacterium]